MNIIAWILALLFGGVDVDKAHSDASTALAYASVAVPEPKPPKPDKPDKPDGDKPKTCECKDGCNCGPVCECPGCKKDGSCCDCGKKQPIKAVWQWVKTGELTGEYKKVEGDKVLSTTKYKRTKFTKKVCGPRSCKLVTEYTPWVEIK